MTTTNTRIPQAEPTAFSVHAAAYRAAVATYEAHLRAHEPPTDAQIAVWQAYESSYSALVTAMRETGLAAVKAPAANPVEVMAKLEIYEAQEFEASSDTDEILALTKAFADDAVRLGGAA